VESFSWVIPRQLAGMARPGLWGDVGRDLKALARAGVGAVVSLTETPLEAQALGQAKLEILHLPVPDFTPPTQAQIDTFVAFARGAIDRKVAVAVHCTGGLGRTGTMLACYLAALGESAAEAIESVRRIRPGSIETAGQEDCIREYARRCAAGEAAPRTGGPRPPAPEA
jgi:atypical dual specificity phosphatase